MKQKTEKAQRVLIALSGGVASAVAGVLLKSQGYEVIGVHFRLLGEKADSAERSLCRCGQVPDTAQVRKMAEKLDIPLHVVHLEEIFQDRVLDYVVHEYLQARLPSPCVPCNQVVKFESLAKKADELSCPRIATGHFAQVSQDLATGTSHLHKGSDLQQDQSYLLYGLDQKILNRTLMPLGGLTYQMVTKLSEQFAYTPDSRPKFDPREWCFVDRPGYAEMIESRVAPSLRLPGMVRDAKGEVIGEHPGVHRFRIGQQTGLSLKLEKPEEVFVLGVDQVNRVVIVGPEQNLFHSDLTAGQLKWLRSMDGIQGIRCKSRVSPNGEDFPCQVTLFENSVAYVHFDEPQRAITPGQAVVFYDENEVLGGGIIDRIGTKP